MKYIVELAGPDWQESYQNQWYAQNEETGKFAFGESPLDALTNLLAEEE